MSVVWEQKAFPCLFLFDYLGKLRSGNSGKVPLDITTHCFQTKAWHIVNVWNNKCPRECCICSWKLHAGMPIDACHGGICTFAVSVALGCSGRFSSFGPILFKTCLIAAGCGAPGLIWWPCGLTITLALSCLSRPLSGHIVIEQQQATLQYSRCLCSPGSGRFYEAKIEKRLFCLSVSDPPSAYHQPQIYRVNQSRQFPQLRGKPLRGEGVPMCPALPFR